MIRIHRNYIVLKSLGNWARHHVKANYYNTSEYTTLEMKT